MYRLLTFLLLIFLGCTQSNKKFIIDDAYRSRFPIEHVVKDREGYLQLAGLFELNPATLNSFGSASQNNFVIKIDSLPAVIGTIQIVGDSLIFDTDDSIYALNERDSIVDRMQIETGELLHYKRWRWMVIERVGKYFLRIWDRANPAVQNFKGYDLYPLTSDYIFEGQFKYYPTSKREQVKSVLGDEEIEFIGNVTFEYEGTPYTLEVGKDGFTIIADKTSAIETYGGGRYMYIDLPTKDSVAIVDFNFAYNPPCTFSTFTTCLLPPKQNILPFSILAGEKYSNDH